jgi:hypothetical protein
VSALTVPAVYVDPFEVDALVSLSHDIGLEQKRAALY